MDRDRVQHEGDPKRAVRAAQYVRMSTEHQKYSTENQAEAIAAYAARRGFEIVETYQDAGKSGLRLDGRAGLQKLIADVKNGLADFKAILVYDISRWGRFQDSDESAYYEFICREAGLAVHYCAEQFENDGSLSATVWEMLSHPELRPVAALYALRDGVDGRRLKAEHPADDTSRVDVDQYDGGSDLPTAPSFPGKSRDGEPSISPCQVSQKHGCAERAAARCRFALRLARPRRDDDARRASSQRPISLTMQKAGRRTPLIVALKLVLACQCSRYSARG
nr:recombinase family protein [uncultured Brevundimonas sp.]